MKKAAAVDPEAVVKNLRKIAANKVCPNCGTQSEFGFGNVCVKFSSFVCDMCKTSHQVCDVLFSIYDVKVFRVGF
jgi:translation elongation factor EF-1beta